jgi:hypothetical protein
VSYDLFFRGRVPGATVARDEFVAYFAERRHYELKDTQAWYSNEDTGVYFVFDYDEPESSEEVEAERDSSLLPVSLNLNYYRPHSFGVEAEPEVRSFVEDFDLTVSDPQTSGMGDGEYSADGFLRGWNAGNEFAYGAIVHQEPKAARLSLPAWRIEAAWRWNYQREERQDQIGETAFVPRVFFFDVKGVVRTGVAWGDGIPILLPEVDLVLVPRDQLAPRRLFRAAAKDIVVFPWAVIQPILKRFREVPGDLSCFELLYEQTPSDVEQLIRQAKPPDHKPEGVGFDQVLDQELLDRARTSTS